MSHWSAVPTLLFFYISQLLRDSFSVYQQPPIWEPPSHYSMSKALISDLQSRFAIIFAKVLNMRLLSFLIKKILIKCRKHKGFLLLFTIKTLGHQVGPPTSRQYVATTWEKISELIDWIGGELAALALVMQHGNSKQQRKTLVKVDDTTCWLCVK